MYQTINLYQFRDAFHRANRGGQFSHEGLGVLFDYLENWEADAGEDLELDVIAICCDFAEDTWQSIAANYSIDIDKTENEDEQEEQVRQYLEDEGALLGEVSGGFVYRQF